VALTLTLVRHGRTEYNAQNRLQGWCDSPLTSGGLAGVRTTAAHLAGRPFTAAYVSPSGRTQVTAREILAHHRSVTPVTDPDLREFGFGEHEAGPETVLFAQYDPDIMFDEVLNGTFAGLPGGEAGPGFLGRVRSAFARIERCHGDGHVLVVSHGLTLLAYLTMINARPGEPLANASISTVEVYADGRHEVTAAGLDPSGEGLPHVTGPSLAPALAN
jgi:probable phosphoglycerate mutase